MRSMFDLSRVRAGDKVLLRDGSKIVVDDRGGTSPPMVFTTYLSVWKKNGSWAPDSYPNNPFDIVGIIYAPRERKTNVKN